MGSLMAGWGSTVKDPRAVKYQRNRSLTRLEIDSYWQSQKRTDEERISTSFAALKENQENIHEGSIQRLQRSSSLPMAGKRESSLNDDSKKDGEKLNMTNCWWTRSNWAFLNEPPVTAMEGPSYKYASQYNVTVFGTAKAVNNSEIST